MIIDSPFVICGLHRSGTTFIGEILRQVHGVCVVHEPLNPLFGVCGVPGTYLYVSKNENSEASTCIDDVVQFRRPWSRHVKSGASLRGAAVALTGGRSGLRWGSLCYRHRFGLSVPAVCWKDPFATLATPYLIQRWQARIICMVRHPAAIHVSTAKQGWSFTVDNLRRQKELREAYGQDVSAADWKLAEQHDAASIALLWKFMVRINLSLSETEDKIKLVRHEDLCLKPMATTGAILTHCGLVETERVRCFVDSRCHGDRVYGKPGRIHDFERDSKRLIDAWRSDISPLDWKLIKQIAGAELRVMYPEVTE